MSALTKRSTKLYNDLSNKQKAILTFQNLTELNADEVPIIAGTVERKEYSQRHIEYTDQVETLYSVASLWGIAYWQQKYLEATCLLLVAEQGTDLAASRYREVEARVTALHYALQEFCNTHGQIAKPCTSLNAGLFCACYSQPSQRQPIQPIDLVRLIGKNNEDGFQAKPAK